MAQALLAGADALKCILALMSLSVYTLKDISASHERLCHLLRKNYTSACAIC